MLRRVVKMTFRAEACQQFEALFARKRSSIRNFPGCQHLELWRDQNDPNLYFTYSHWQDAEALQNYRHSELFQKTWAATKQLFADRPAAWSVDQVDLVEPN